MRSLIFRFVCLFTDLHHSTFVISKADWIKYRLMALFNLFTLVTWVFLVYALIRAILRESNYVFQQAPVILGVGYSLFCLTLFIKFYLKINLLSGMKDAIIHKWRSLKSVDVEIR